MTTHEKPRVEKRADRHDESVETHPGYGQITASRVSAGGKGAVLYGSDFRHHHWVTIQVHESDLHRTNNHDWPHARKELINVSLTEAQWARFVSAMNTGDGAQCTIERVDGVLRPDIDALPDRSNQFREELRDDLADAIKRVDELKAKVESGKTSKKDLLDALHMIRLRIDDNVPYVARSFDEHMEQAKEKARIEINAHVTATIQRAGIAAIAGQAPFELADGDDEGKE